MAKIIIGIHGLANKMPKATLEDWWKKSIREGLRNIGYTGWFEFKMVFWADKLYKNILHDDKDFYFDNLYNNEPYKAARAGTLKRHNDSVADEARRIAGSVFGGAADQLKGWFGDESPVDAALGNVKVLRDLFFYYERKPIRARDGGRKDTKTVLKRVLADELVAGKDKSIMLVGHSMGSIIAYDVMRDLGRSDDPVSVSHFATIGSPLGLSFVRGKIVEERHYSGRRVRTPSFVTSSWKNFADGKDPVALDSHLSDDYDENDKGIKVQDDLVANNYQSPAGEPNHHKSYGYLRTPEFSEYVRDFLKAKTE